MTAGRQLTRADALDRAGKAWRLRVSGAPWAEIAATLGYANDANVIRAVRSSFGKLPQPDREELRTMWRERHEVLYRIAATDAEDRRPGAVRSAVAVARSAAQLDGLDAPTKVQISPASEEFERVMALVMGRGAAVPVEGDIFEIEGVVDAEIVDEIDA